LIIGIDLDNTIIDYRNAFWHTALSTGIFTEKDKISFSNNHGQVPNKNEIKNRLILEEGGNYKWESLQGQVYGQYIHNAGIYPGVANFLLHSKVRGVKVYIISHKTEFGHYDKSQTPLRKAALNFLEQKDILSGDYGIQEKDIFFFDARRKKVNMVAELNCTYFIDDLPEVFREEGFPENTTEILFDIQSEHAMNYTFNSWRGINELVFNQIKTSDIAAYVEKGVNKKVKSVQIIKGRGNSSVYKIEMNSGQKFAGKLYPDPTFDDRDRLEKESKACRFLHSNEIKTVPGNIWSDTNLNFGLFEWINGKEIVEITDDHVNRAAEFVALLDELSKHTSHDKFEQASAACISGQMIEQQIRDRYATICEFSDFNSELRRFLEDDFAHTFETVLSKSKKLWPGKFEEQLSHNCQLLSPSDFGFHNIFLTKDGFKFFDFEYFGWDDPVKLACDFLLHPGMVLSDKQKTLWLGSMKEIFSNDRSFSQRLRVSYGLYGLCWCLIILNVFTDSHGEKIISVVENNKMKQKQYKQLEKSKKMLIHINETHKNTLPYE
jgi:hypothetical protein